MKILKYGVLNFATLATLVYGTNISNASAQNLKLDEIIAKHGKSYVEMNDGSYRGGLFALPFTDKVGLVTVAHGLYGKDGKKRVNDNIITSIGGKSVCIDGNWAETSYTSYGQDAAIAILSDEAVGSLDLDGVEIPKLKVSDEDNGCEVLIFNNDDMPIIGTDVGESFSSCRGNVTELIQIDALNQSGNSGSNGFDFEGDLRTIVAQGRGRYSVKGDIRFYRNTLGVQTSVIRELVNSAIVNEILKEQGYESSLLEYNTFEEADEKEGILHRKNKVYNKAYKYFGKMMKPQGKFTLEAGIGSQGGLLEVITAIEGAMPYMLVYNNTGQKFKGDRHIFQFESSYTMSGSNFYKKLKKTGLIGGSEIDELFEVTDIQRKSLGGNKYRYAVDLVQVEDILESDLKILEIKN